MAKTVQPIAIELGIKGGEKLGALNRAFRDLSKQTKLADKDIVQAAKDIVKFANDVGNAEATIKGQIKAFEGLREQAAMGGKVYRSLSSNIEQLKSNLRGSTNAIEKKRESLVGLATQSKNNAAALAKVVVGLQRLKSLVREDSAAYRQLNSDIEKTNKSLTEINVTAAKARFTINQALAVKPEKIVPQIKRIQAAIASGTLEAQDLARALLDLELLNVGAGRAGAVRKAQAFDDRIGKRYFDSLRKNYEDLAKTSAIISQRISEVNTELANVTGYERRRALTIELINLNKELRSAVINVRTAEEFQGLAIRQRMGRARESYAESGFGAFSADIRQRTAAGEFTPGMERARKRAKNRIVNEEAVKGVTDIFSTWVDSYDRIERAANDHKVEMARIQASQGDLLIQTEDRKHDQKLRAQQEQYDEEIRLFDQKLKQRDRVLQRSGSVKSMLGLSGRELSPLYGGIVGIGEARARGEQARMGRTPQQALADVVNVFNSDLSRTGDGFLDAEKKLRESAIDFAGGSKRVRQKFEDIALGKTPMAMFPQAGESKGDYRKRIEGSARNLFESVRNFGDRLKGAGDGFLAAEKKMRESAIKFANNSVEIERAFKQVPLGKTPMSMFPGTSETPESYVQRMRGGFAQFDLPDFSSFRKGTTRELQLVRESLAELRLDLDPLAVSFEKTEKRIVQSISKIDKELERRQGGRRRLSAMQMTQAAGAAISGGIFGGPEGFLGGVGGALVGGVGGAFAGAAFGAQVGGVRRTLGEYTEYAAQIARLKIALEGIAGPQNQYNRALAAAADVTKSLNVPQDVAIQGITRLTAAVKGAGGGVADAELAFKNINAAIIATGGGAEQVEGAVTALVQIFSKGKVSAEEINQIAERLPGTFNKIAAASGRTGPELTKALQQGEVGLNDLMKFLVSLGNEYGELAKKIAGSSENAGARLQVAFDQMRVDVGNALQPIGAEFQDIFTKFIEDITPTLVAVLPKIGEAFLAIAKNIDTVAIAMTAALGVLAVGKIAAIIGSIGGLAAAIFTLKLNAVVAAKALVGLNTAAMLNPYTALAAGVAAFAANLFLANKRQKELNNLIRQGPVAEVQSKISQLQSEQAEIEQRSLRPRSAIESAGDLLLGVDPRAADEIRLAKIKNLLPKLRERLRIAKYDAEQGAALDSSTFGLTVFDDPKTEGDEPGSGTGKATKLRQSRLGAIQATEKLLGIEKQILDNARQIRAAQAGSNFERVNQLNNQKISLEFAKRAAENQFELNEALVRATGDKNEAALKAEAFAKKEISDKLLLIQYEAELADEAQRSALAAEQRSKALSDQIFNLREQLLLATDDERIARFKQQQEEQFGKDDPRVAEATDLFRQTVAPTFAEGLNQQIRAAEKELNNLYKVAWNVSQGIGNAVANSLTNGVTGLIEGTKNAKEVFADFLKDVGRMLAQEGAKMIATYIAIGVAKIFAGLGSATAGGGSSLETITSKYGSFGAEGAANAAKSLPPLPRANGGPARAGQPYMVGERGPELFVPSSNGGVMRNEEMRQLMGRSPVSSGAPAMNFTFETTNIGGTEYVSREQLEAAMAATRRQAAAEGAKRGMSMTFDKMQNSPRTRSRIGIS